MVEKFGIQTFKRVYDLIPKFDNIFFRIQILVLNNFTHTKKITTIKVEFKWLRSGVLKKDNE